MIRKEFEMIETNHVEKKELVVVKEHIGTLHSWVCAFTIHSFTRCTKCLNSLYYIIPLLLLANAFLAQSQRPGGSPKGLSIQVEGSGSFFGFGVVLIVLWVILVTKT